MKILSVLLSIIWTFSSFAGHVTTRIHDIILAESVDEHHLILAENGLVYELSQNDELLEMATNAKNQGLEIGIVLGENSILKDALNDRESIIGFEFYSGKSLKSSSSITSTTQGPTPMDNYNATRLSNFDKAVYEFNNMRTGSRWRSQCYNRAHVWAYESHYNLRKVWIFFTRKYIRNYNYKWWFHVTPAVWVDGISEDVILDREFTRKPTLYTEWKNIFMHNNSFCPEVKYYSQYSDNQWSEDCYIIKSSKYYWQPFNIENLEKEGTQKTHWVDWEVTKAYRNGFGVRR